MPRLPVDGTKVIEHRITLGGKEREILESAMTAYSFRNVATPVVTAVNDNTTLLLLAGLVGLLIPRGVLPDDWEEVTSEMGYDELMDWLEVQNLAGAFGGALAGSAAGPVGAALGAILGSIGVEVGEDLLEGVPVAVTAAAMTLQRFLNGVSEATSGGGGTF